MTPKLKRAHANIPIFIPHLGCPNDCVFCDQRTISGVAEFSESDVKRRIEESLATLEGTGKRAEIAFFGGSFTGIDRSLMVRLLDTAQHYVDEGRITGIRMSTRPDYISEEIISVLEKYTVTEVELGIQSMSDRVLAASRRGHTARDTVAACTLLANAKIRFVGQMMIGLPTSTAEDEIFCAREICRLGASACRIYPTIVFRGTCLEMMTNRGEYVPLTTEDAVQRAASVLEIFDAHGVKCLRIGLQDSEEMHSESKYLAGPAHAAMGELVRGEVFFRRIVTALEPEMPLEYAWIIVPCGAVSACVGQGGRNREDLMRRFGLKKIKFTESDELFGFNVKVGSLPIQQTQKNSKEGKPFVSEIT